MPNKVLESSSPILYPAQRGPLTDLNPVYVPFVSPAPGWIAHVTTSYSQTAGNEDWLPACVPPTTTTRCCAPTGACTWTVIPATSGVVTRLYTTQPLVSFGNTISAGRIELYTPYTATEPLVTLDVSQLINADDYPLVVDGKYSSGGIVLYKPFLFSDGLAIRSTGMSPTYFQLHYFETPAPLGPRGWAVPTDTAALAAKWQPGDMGKEVDDLSLAGTPTFVDVVGDLTSTAALAPGAADTIFSDSGTGTVVKISFPATTLSWSPGCPVSTRSPFTDLWLQVRYSDTATAAVSLPLDLVLLSPEADYTPDQPPTADLDAMLFAPTGKHVIVQGDTAWVLEPVNYDLYFQQQDFDNRGAVWYRVGLDEWLAASSGTLPPTSSLDAYSLHSLRANDITATVSSQGEWAITGSNYWSRTLNLVPWDAATLADAWGKDANHPPTDSVSYQTFSFDTDAYTSTPRLEHWIIDWNPISQTRWLSYVPTATITNTWLSRDLELLWSSFYSGQRVDAVVLSPLGETVISGTQYYTCSVTDPASCRGSQGNWSGPYSLSTAWWMDERVYDQGSLFFGYRPVGAEYYLTLPMPYREGIAISLVNHTPYTTCVVTLSTVTYHTPQAYGPGSGYLDVHYVEGTMRGENWDGPGEPLLPGWPNKVLRTTLEGRGKLVGVVRRVRGDIEGCGRMFLESDELIVADKEGIACSYQQGRLVCDCEDQGTYVQCGTGMEEFANAGWYFDQGPFYLPTHGVPLSPPNLLQLPRAETCGIPTGYPWKYLGQVNQREGAAFSTSETYTYRFLLNEAIAFRRSLIVAQELHPCQDPGKTVWSQDAWSCRHDMTTTLGLMTIAYIQPFATDSFLPVVMRDYPITGTLELPSSRPGGDYPPPERPAQPPDEGYPPPLLLTDRPSPSPPAGVPWTRWLAVVALGGLAGWTVWSYRRLWLRQRLGQPRPDMAGPPGG